MLSLSIFIKFYLYSAFNNGYIYIYKVDTKTPVNESLGNDSHQQWKNSLEEETLGLITSVN